MRASLTWTLIFLISCMLLISCGGGNSKNDKQNANQAKNQAGQDANKGQAQSAGCPGVVCPERNICVTRQPDGKYTNVGFNSESGVERCCVGGVCAADANLVSAAIQASPTPTP